MKLPQIKYIKYKRALLSFMAILLIFSGIVDVLMVSFQRRMLLEEAHENARRELELIGTFAREAILKRDYSTVEQFLIQWGEEHAEVVEVKAIAPNNFLLAHYRRTAPSKHIFHLQQHASYEGNVLITLEMVKDFTSVERSLYKLNLQLVSGSVLLIVLLGLALWHALRKLALKPLEREIAKREETEKKFRLLLESAPDAMIFVNQDGKIVMVNGQTEKLFNHSREDLIGEEIELLIPEQLRSIHREERVDYFHNPKSRSMGAGLDLFGLTKDGREFPVDISLSPIKTEEGLFVLADIRDASDRKRAEEKIKRSYYFQSTISSILQISLEPISLEEQLDQILDAILSIPGLSLKSKGSVYLVEDDPQVLVMKAQHGLSEQTRTVCAKVPFGKCLCGLAATTREIEFAEHAESRQEMQKECMFPHGQYCVPITSGDRVLGAINLFVKEGHKRNREEEDLLLSIANTLAGIIERKRIELEKQSLQKQLIQAEKLSALGRLTANVAHEIRNPLTSIGGFAKRLHKRISARTKEKEYAEVIVTEVDRLEKILRNVLTYSRSAPLDKEKHNINEIVDESLKTFEETLKEESIHIQKSLNHVPQIQIDKDQVREVIDNLISNAVDAMPDGGNLTISTKKEFANSKDYVTVKVTDTGEGIPEDKLSMIFEPFFTTKAVGHGHGTGLGLPIIKKIMEEHGGFIRIESTVRKGSIFSLYFPYKG